MDRWGRRDVLRGSLALAGLALLSGCGLLPAGNSPRRIPRIGFLTGTGRSATAEAGGLLAYGVNNPDLYRRAASYVDKILKGANPAELPVEQPTRFDFVINLKTAQDLGLTIPQEVLIQATEAVQ